jgi:AbrB family looped-hinge helix DNA binding protein
MSQALVKLQRKGQMVIPRSLREEVGISEGTLLKVAVVKGGRFLLTPQFTLDRPVVPGDKKDTKKLLRELAEAVAELRGEATAKGIDRISMREINAAVVAARRGPQKTVKRPRK